MFQILKQDTKILITKGRAPIKSEKMKTTQPPEQLTFNEWVIYIFQLIHNLKK